MARFRARRAESTLSAIAFFAAFAPLRETFLQSSASFKAQRR
jgi:hypothetical protein